MSTDLKLARDYYERLPHEMRERVVFKHLLTAIQIAEQRENLVSVAGRARETIRQMATLSNVNDETRRLLIAVGDALNDALVSDRKAAPQSSPASP